jgi:hypothetical protein
MTTTRPGTLNVWALSEEIRPRNLGEVRGIRAKVRAVGNAVGLTRMASGSAPCSRPAPAPHAT